MNWMGGAKARMKKYLQEKQKKKQFNHNPQLSIIKQSSVEKKKPIAIKHANHKKTSILSNEIENIDTLSYKNLTKNDIHLFSNPKSTQNDGLQIELSDDSKDVSNQPLQTVHHTIQFIDNGKDRTQEVYNHFHIQYIPSSPPETTIKQSIPLLDFSPSSSSQEEFHDDNELYKEKENELWKAIDNHMDLFSNQFQSILTTISPNQLSLFTKNTIQLLLEICYSYLSNSDQQLQNIGISILDSIITFVLSNNSYSTEISFCELYERIQTTPPFQAFSSAYENQQATIIHLQQKLNYFIEKKKKDH